MGKAAPNLAFCDDYGEPPTETKEQALDRAIETITHEYFAEINADEAPNDSWLVKNTCFDY